MRVYGHRGSAATVTENTVAGVRAALAAGADGVEVDVRQTADGVLVCSHDPGLGRLGGPAEPVCALGWDHLSAVRLAGDEPVARLADVLDAAAGRGTVICEVKNMPGEPDFDAPAERTSGALVDLLEQRAAARGGPDDVVVSSFDWFAIDHVHARRPDIATAFLTPSGLAVRACLAYVLEHGHHVCHPQVDVLLGELQIVGHAHAKGVEVVCWTVDDPDVARRLADAGVDGVITNDPAAMLAALA